MELSSPNRENIGYLESEKISISLEIKSTEEKLKQLLQQSQELDEKLKLEKNEGVKEINILDIPVLVWQKITALTSDNDEDLINQCLASPVLDDIVTTLCLAGRKENLIADKVFSILVQNKYLYKDDLQNCVSMNAQNDAIEIAALRTWRLCPENNQEDDERLTVMFESENKMLLFERNVDSHGKYSKMFIGKTFKFFYRPSRNENGTYWPTAKRIVRKYKRYILRVLVTFVDDYYGIAQGSLFSCFCLKTLDRFQRLFCEDKLYPIGRDMKININELEERIDARTRRRYFEIETDEPCVYKNSLFKMVAPIVELWDLYEIYPIMGDIKLDKLKVLDVKLWKPVTCDELLKSESLRGLGKIEKLSFAYLPLAHFEESKLPNCIKSVIDLQLWVHNLRYRNEQNVSWGPWKLMLPNVKKLTLNFAWVGEYYPPLASFVTTMKSLQHIILKLNSKTQLEKLFEQGLIEDDADIYQLYGQGRSLKESNIWEIAPGLNSITVDTPVSRDEDTQKLRNIEKYMRSRITGNIEFQEYVLQEVMKL